MLQVLENFSLFWNLVLRSSIEECKVKQVSEMYCIFLCVIQKNIACGFLVS